MSYFFYNEKNIPVEKQKTLIKILFQNEHSETVAIKNDSHDENNDDEAEDIDFENPDKLI